MRQKCKSWNKDEVDIATSILKDMITDYPEDFAKVLYDVLVADVPGIKADRFRDQFIALIKKWNSKSTGIWVWVL